MGVIWFSERDDWGQLYLCDLETGKLKNPITTGEGNVTQVLGVDEKTLSKANKDFDLVLLPNQRHGYGDAANYMTRRRWDYSCDIS